MALWLQCFIWQFEFKTDARRQLESLIGTQPYKRLLYGSACYIEHAKPTF